MTELCSLTLKWSPSQSSVSFPCFSSLSHSPHTLLSNSWEMSSVHQTRALLFEAISKWEKLSYWLHCPVSTGHSVELHCNWAKAGNTGKLLNIEVFSVSDNSSCVPRTHTSPFLSVKTSWSLYRVVTTQDTVSHKFLKKTIHRCVYDCHNIPSLSVWYGVFPCQYHSM